MNHFDWILVVRPPLYSWNKLCMVVIWLNRIEGLLIFCLRFLYLRSQKILGFCLHFPFDSEVEFFTPAWFPFYPIYRRVSIGFASIISLTNFPLRPLSALSLAEQKKTSPETKQSQAKCWFNHSLTMCSLTSYRSSWSLFPHQWTGIEK